MSFTVYIFGISSIFSPHGALIFVLIEMDKTAGKIKASSCLGTFLFFPPNDHYAVMPPLMALLCLNPILSS